MTHFTPLWIISRWSIWICEGNGVLKTRQAFVMGAVKLDDWCILELFGIDGVAQLCCLVWPGNSQCKSWNEVIDYGWDYLSVQ